MATDKEIRAVLSPVLAQYPDWRYARGWLFRLPIGYYLRGVVLKGSWSSRDAYQVLRCVYPLFDFSTATHIGYSMSFPIPGTTNHGWNIFHPAFAHGLLEVMGSDIVQSVSQVQKGSEFLSYLTNNYTMHGWPNAAKALAYIHIGDLDKARELLAPDAHTIRTRFPMLEAPGTWGHNLLELLRLIEEDPGAVPTHCEAVARQSVKINKLEKYWEDAPFVYENIDNTKPV